MHEAGRCDVPADLWMPVPAIRSSCGTILNPLFLLFSYPEASPIESPQMLNEAFLRAKESLVLSIDTLLRRVPSNSRCIEPMALAGSRSYDSVRNFHFDAKTELYLMYLCMYSAMSSYEIFLPGSSLGK